MYEASLYKLASHYKYFIESFNYSFLDFYSHFLKIWFKKLYKIILDYYIVKSFYSFVKQFFRFFVKSL